MASEPCLLTCIVFHGSSLLNYSRVPKSDQNTDFWIQVLHTGQNLVSAYTRQFQQGKKRLRYHQKPLSHRSSYRRAEKETDPSPGESSVAASWGVLLVLSCVTLKYGALAIPLGISCPVPFCFVSMWYKRQNKKRISFGVQTRYSLEITEGACAACNLLEEPVGVLCCPLLGLKALQAAALPAVPSSPQYHCSCCLGICCSPPCFWVCLDVADNAHLGKTFLKEVIPLMYVILRLFMESLKH